MRDARCLIIGAGVGGTAAGIALGQRGFDVDVVERNADDATLGVGINLPPNALKVVSALGVIDECRRRGFPARGRALLDHKGNETFTEVFDDEGGHPRETGIPRPELSDILLGACRSAGARVRYGTTVADRHDHDGRVAVSFSDGTRGEYDLVVAFDGIRSQTRAELFGSASQATFTGYGALRINLDRPADLDRILLFIGPDNKAGLVPISEEAMYLFLVIDAPERWRPSPIELVDRLRDELSDYGGLLGEVRDGLSETSKVIYSPVEEVRLDAPWNRGRVLVAGDAAHACAPHLTQGGAQAFEDALVLAEELESARDVPGAIAAFSQRRARRAQRIQELSRIILDGEMNPAPDHRETWPAQFGKLMGEANALIATSA